MRWTDSLSTEILTTIGIEWTAWTHQTVEQLSRLWFDSRSKTRCTRCSIFPHAMPQFDAILKAIVLKVGLFQMMHNRSKEIYKQLQMENYRWEHRFKRSQQKSITEIVGIENRYGCCSASLLASASSSAHSAEANKRIQCNVYKSFISAAPNVCKSFTL